MKKSRVITISFLAVVAVGVLFKIFMDINYPPQVKLNQEQLVKRVHYVAEKDDALFNFLHRRVEVQKSQSDFPESTFEVTKVTINDDSIAYHNKEFNKHGKNSIWFTGYINDDPSIEFIGIVANPGSDAYLSTEQSAVYGDMEDRIGVRNSLNIDWENYQ